MKEIGSGRRSRRAAAAAAAIVVSMAAIAASQAASSEARIGTRDLIEVKVREASEFDGSFRVSENGSIRHPILGDVELAGLSLEQAEALLTDVLEDKFLLEGRATVSVAITELRSQAIRVIGAVKKPGPLELAGGWTLIEALTEAGGLSSDHGNVVRVLRRADNGLTDQIEVSTDDLFVKADPRVNIPLRANDLVSVPETVEVTIYCLGEVANPGAHVFKSNDRITLLTAIARAGGLTDRASRGKIVISRQLPSGEQEEISVDYRKVYSGRLPDVPLQAGDVVRVKQSFF